MSNNECDDGVTLTGRTCRNEYDSSTTLVIPKEFAKELDIESSKVSMSLLDDFGGNKHLVISKYYKEIVIE